MGVRHSPRFIAASAAGICRTSASASAIARHDHAALGRGRELDVVRVVPGLRDDAQPRQRLQQLAREAGALAVRDQGVELPQPLHGLSLFKDHDLGAPAQARDARRALVGGVDIVENGDAHVIL